jgi:predicted metal-dependent phosphotriesterase family hydrolase
MRLFVAERVDPGKVQIAHTGDTDELDHIEELTDEQIAVMLDENPKAG